MSKLETLSERLTDSCPDCGRDLSKLGPYRDFIHFRPDGYVCGPLVFRFVDDLVRVSDET